MSDATPGGLENEGSEGPRTSSSAGFDYFISRRGGSAAIAQEVAEVLMSAGYTVYVQDYNIPRGANFVAAIHDALKRGRHLVVLLTKDYDASEFTLMELTNFLAAAARSAEDRRIVLLRIEDCNPEGVLAGMVFGDLVGIEDPPERRRRILAAAEGRSIAAPRRPKILENLPPRDLNFTGRAERLAALHEILSDFEGPAATMPIAILGLGGMGKTTLAAEYAYRNAGLFAGVWWAPAQERALLVGSLAALAGRLDPRLEDEPDHVKAAHAGLTRLARSGLPFLLIYDNVQSPDSVRDLLPTAGARVLLTTRWSDWGGQAVVLKLGELSPDAAAEFLQKRAHRTDVAGADSLAKALGFLPLALDHAAAYCRLTGSSFNSYRDKIDERIMRAPKGVAYPASVAATFGLAAEQAASECAEATEVLGFFSYLATERIPVDLIHATIADEEARAEALMALAAVSLIEYVALDDGAQGVTLHRLVQAAMRAGLAERGFAATFIGRATVRLTEVFPKDALGDPTVWSRCAVLLPHVLALRDHAGEEWESCAAAGNLLAATTSYLHGRGDHRDAEPLARQAIEIAEHIFGREHPDVIHRLGALANLLRDTGRYAEAEALYREGLTTCERTPGRAQTEVAGLLNNLALLLWNSGRYVEAEPLSQKALAITQIAEGNNELAFSTSLTNRANLLKNTGRLVEAEPMFRQAIAIGERTLGHDHPTVVASRNNLGSLLRDTGQYSEAELLYRDSLEIEKRIFGHEHPNIGTSLSSLARLLRYMNRHAEAELLARDALEIFRRDLGPGHPLIGRAQENLARILLQSGRVAEAIKEAEAAFVVHEKSLFFENVWRRESAATYADTLAVLGRDDEARIVRERYSLTSHSGIQPPHTYSKAL
jgi:tetratricopeptide (TPR) repeat protein